MTVGVEWEADVARARAAAAGLGELAGLAEAALERVAREGADADGSAAGRVQAVLEARGFLDTLLVGLLRRMDGAVEIQAVAFGRLKQNDGSRGNPARQARSAPVNGPKTSRFDVLATHLQGWLHAADGLLRMFHSLSDTLKRCHAAAETVFGDVVAGRQVALVALEAAQKRSQENRPPLKQAAFGVLAARSEEERLSLATIGAQRQATLDEAEADEAERLSRFTGLDAVAAQLDLYVAGVNAALAALNVLRAKLSTDSERALLLRAAVLSFAGVQVAVAEAAAVEGEPAGLEPLMALERKGLLSHAETVRRKALADSRFERYFEGSGGG